jgi:hypothetical protein
MPVRFYPVQRLVIRVVHALLGHDFPAIGQTICREPPA